MIGLDHIAMLGADQQQQLVQQATACKSLQPFSLCITLPCSRGIGTAWWLGCIEALGHMTLGEQGMQRHGHSVMANRRICLLDSMEQARIQEPSCRSILVNSLGPVYHH